MAVQLSQEATRTLQGYVAGRVSNAELADWLAGAEYDPAISEDERDELAGIRLVLIEAQEGRRDVEEVLDSVAWVLATAQPGTKIMAERTESSTEWITKTKLTAASPVQRVGI
jgi:hypothetical protein